MVETEQGNKWGRVIVIIIVIVIAIAVLITFFVGLSGLRQFFTWMFGILFGLSILFLIAYLFYILFIQKTYKDIPATYRKKLMQTAKLMKNNMLGDLYLSGDEKHNRIKMGKFAYLRIILPKQHTTIIEEVPPELAHLKKPKTIEETEPVPVDCFVLIKTKFWDRLFGMPVFILVKPQDHNYSSIFNDVIITGFNLVPLDSQFFTIDRRNLDTDIIRGLATNYIREVVYEIFRDLDRTVKQAMNLDQQFQKDKQKGLEFEIPRIGNIGGEQHR
jgi:hypothetical protein